MTSLAHEAGSASTAARLKDAARFLRREAGSTPIAPTKSAPHSRIRMPASQRSPEPPQVLTSAEGGQSRLRAVACGMTRDDPSLGPQLRSRDEFL